MLKKTYLISAYSSLQASNICASHPSSSASKTSPSKLPNPRARPSTRPRRNSQWRSYATVRDGKGPDFRDNMNWPCKSSANTTPTPYEIFDLERGAVYSKHKYYQLVKLYHPDKHGHYNDDTSITQVERLERYRLVVQAHEILSDPTKRRAYDAYGAGWGSSRTSSTRHTRGYTNAAGKEYGFGPEHDSTVFGNATWEDWERWYRKRDEPESKQAYSGIYMNPNLFASFVILMAVLTGVIQATRAGQYSESIGAKVDALTEETAQFLSARAQEYTEKNLKADDRVRTFLERRDPTRYGLRDEETEAYKKHFADSQRIAPKVPVKDELG
jgi:curved DNA-binding protein CbpA